MVRNPTKPTKSLQPRKQRKARYKAPFNRRRRMMASPLSKELYEKHEYYPRRMTVRKGDVIMVTRGGFRGHEGKVIGVDLKKMRITIDGVTYQKADGKSVPKPVDPSNVEIIKLDLSDRRRKKRFERILLEQELTEEELREAEEELEALESIEIPELEDEELPEEEFEEEVEGEEEKEEPETSPTEEPERDMDINLETQKERDEKAQQEEEPENIPREELVRDTKTDLETQKESEDRAEGDAEGKDEPGAVVSPKAPSPESREENVQHEDTPSALPNEKSESSIPEKESKDSWESISNEDREMKKEEGEQ